MNDLVNNPKHYTQHKSGIKCIEITEHLNFNRGNAIKYAWRANDKGATLQDFDKAKWYVNREISRLERVNEVPHYAYELDKVYNKISQYYKDYEFDKRLCDFIRNMIHGGEDSLLFAIKIIDSWIKELDK